MEWGEISANHICDKGLVSRIYMKYLKLKKKKEEKSIFLNVGFMPNMRFELTTLRSQESHIPLTEPSRCANLFFLKQRMGRDISPKKIYTWPRCT